MDKDRTAGISLRPATRSDARLIWEWRNEGGSRKASFNDGFITFAQHEVWFTRRLADPNTQFVVGLDDGGAAFGYVRFDRQGDGTTVSIAIATDRRGQGLGPELLAAACRAMFTDSSVVRVTALVRKDNPASVATFRRARFTHDGDVVVEGIEAARLTLDRPAVR